MSRVRSHGQVYVFSRLCLATRLTLKLSSIRPAIILVPLATANESAHVVFYRLCWKPLILLEHYPPKSNSVRAEDDYH